MSHLYRNPPLDLWQLDPRPTRACWPGRMNNSSDPVSACHTGGHVAAFFRFSHSQHSVCSSALQSAPVPYAVESVIGRKRDVAVAMVAFTVRASATLSSWPASCILPQHLDNNCPRNFSCTRTPGKMTFLLWKRASCALDGW